MNNHLHQLKNITGILLSPNLNYTAVRDACISLSAFFCELSGFNIGARENQEHIISEAGQAVSPFTAAHCVTDMMRTRNFLQGIRDAIDEKAAQKKEEPVIVLYAGTGPFATLLTPLTTIYTPTQLQLVLMDINPISIQYLQKIIEKLHLHPYIIDLVEADAASYIIPSRHQPDILVSETMKPGLLKEPQVNITANLVPQCTNQTILIPERIEVNACLAGNVALHPEDFITLSALLQLDKQTAMVIKKTPGLIPVLSEGVVVIIPDNTGHALVLGTIIKIFNKHYLKMNESSLTVNHRLMDVSAIGKLPARVLFKYHLKNEPGFSVSVID